MMMIMTTFEMEGKKKFLREERESQVENGFRLWAENSKKTKELKLLIKSRECIGVEMERGCCYGYDLIYIWGKVKFVRKFRGFCGSFLWENSKGCQGRFWWEVVDGILHTINIWLLSTFAISMKNNEIEVIDERCQFGKCCYNKNCVMCKF